jgi:membrane protein
MPIAVLYKFFDDQGNYLAALIAYYGFISLFPLLLLFTTVLGFLLEDNQGLHERALHSALDNFPIIGEQIGANLQHNPAHGSFAALFVAVLGALYGGLGVLQATQNALNTVWAVPKNERPNPFKARGRSISMLGVGALGLAATAALAALPAHYLGEGDLLGVLARILTSGLAIALNTALFMLAFRQLTAGGFGSFRLTRPGAVLAAIGWQLLQLVGELYVRHTLNGSTGSYGVFGVVLGLLAFLYLSATLFVLSAELNAVRARQLWPRALLTPFTDNVELTEGDRRAYTTYAMAQQSKGFERVSVEFPTQEPPPR